jgi:hypothetical protein
LGNLLDQWRGDRRGRIDFVDSLNNPSHTPLYPLSRDTARYSGLQRALGAYRMVFGQPRQDELMAYLFWR